MFVWNLQPIIIIIMSGNQLDLGLSEYGFHNSYVLFRISMYHIIPLY